MLDLLLIKLQYEILNKPLDQIATDEGTSLFLLTKQAKEANWKQWWPETEKIAFVQDEDAPINDSEILALESEQYIANTRARLKVYTLAKELILAQRYLTLECDIIAAATTIAASAKEYGPAGIKQLSALFKDMTSGSNLANLASMTISADESGLPSVVIRDMSGRR